jgi:hypothetical protein
MQVLEDGVDELLGGTFRRTWKPDGIFDLAVYGVDGGEDKDADGLEVKLVKRYWEFEGRVGYFVVLAS